MIGFSKHLSICLLCTFLPAMWCTGHWPTEAPACFLSRPQPTPTLVATGRLLLRISSPTSMELPQPSGSSSGLRIKQGACLAKLLLRFGDEWVKSHDLSSLRVLGSVGEPLNQEAWQWFHQVVGGGQCDLVDTWWQTETGGVAIAPRPSSPGAPLRPGKPQRPMFGMNPVILDSDGLPLKGPSVSGALCLGTPWPGIARFLNLEKPQCV